MYRFVIVILGIIICHAFLAKAQQYDLAYQQFTTEEGLSNNFVTAIIQDQDGFIWLGTQEGLNRFDGYNFEVYKANTSETYQLASNHITFLREDTTRNCIWIGTLEGLSRLNLNDNTIDRIDFFNQKRINYIYLDSQKQIWVASNNGIFKTSYPHKTEQPIEWTSAAYNLSSTDSYVFIGEKILNGKPILLLAERYNVLDHYTFFKYLPTENKWHKLLITNHNIQYIEKNGKIWTSYKEDNLRENSHTTIYDNTVSLDSIYFEKPRSAKAMIPFTAFENNLQDDKVWFVDVGGLALVNLKNKKIENWYYWKYFTESADQYTVECIFRDKSNTYWIGTQGLGFFIFNDYTLNNFRTYKYSTNSTTSLSHPSVRGIYRDEATKDTWISTYSRNNEIDIFKGDSLKKTIWTDSYVHLITPDISKKNILWFATTSGLRKVDKYTYQLLESYKTPKILLTGILMTNDSTIWLTENEALHCFNPITKRFVDYSSIKDLSFIFQTQAKEIWLGFTNKGIGKLNTNTLEINYFNPIQDTSQNCYVKYIHEDANHNFWIATTYGFYFWNRKTNQTQHFTEQNGLANNITYAILEEEDGYLWISTNKGISKFNPKTESFTNFDKQDGLQDNEFNTYSYFKSPSGELFFGGLRGVNAFYPKQMKKNTFVPPIHLTAFEKLGEKQALVPIINTKTIELPIEEAQLLTFRFAALNFYQGTKNEYAYRIEPIQKDWIYLGTKNELTLTNLVAGTYTLHIKGSNNHSIWNEEGIQLQLKIIPPFWQTTWFYGTLILLLISSFYIFYRVRSHQATVRAAYLESQIEERTHEIKTQTEELRSVNERLQELDSFKEKVTNMLVHDLKNPLGMIIHEAKNNDVIRKASQNMMNMLLTLLDTQKIQHSHFELHKENIWLSKLIVEVKNDMALFLHEKNLVLDYISNIDFLIHADKSILYRVLTNLLSNAIKYSPHQGKITILTSQVSTQSVQISIKDYGIGIEAHELHQIFETFKQAQAKNMGAVSSTGLGLSFCKMAVEAHGGKLLVQSVPNQETTFYFTLPFIELKNNCIKESNKIAIIHLTKEEQVYLQTFQEQLASLKVYQLSQIRQILQKIDTPSKPIQAWKTQLQEIVYTGDEKAFQELLHRSLHEIQ